MAGGVSPEIARVIDHMVSIFDRVVNLSKREEDVRRLAERLGFRDVKLHIEDDGTVWTAVDLNARDERVWRLLKLARAAYIGSGYGMNAIPVRLTLLITTSDEGFEEYKVGEEEKNTPLARIIEEIRKAGYEVFKLVEDRRYDTDFMDMAVKIAEEGSAKAYIVFNRRPRYDEDP